MRGNKLTFQTASRSEETRQWWPGKRPLHIHSPSLCPGTARPAPQPQPAPSSRALTAGAPSGESEACWWKSPSGSPAPTTRLIQTPALSIVHPPRFSPAKVSMTQVPLCSLEGWYCSQTEQTHHSEIPSPPFIESNFSFPSFPSVMFLLDPFGPPTVPALQTCTVEFPNMIWSMTHVWIVCSLGCGTGVPSLRFRNTGGPAL